MNSPVIGNHIEMYPAGDKMSVFNKSTGKTYVFGAAETKTIVLFDGKRSIEEISRESEIYSVEDIKRLVEALSAIGMFKEEKRKQHWFKLKIPVFNPNKLFKTGGFFTELFFSLIIFGSLALLFAGVIANATSFGGLFTKINSPDQILAEFLHMGILDWVIITLCSLVCLVLHELGHTIAARHYNVNVPEIGFMLYFLVPCAYTNISGINLLENKRKRIVVLLAGTFVNLGLIGIFYLFLGYVDAHTAAILLALIVANAVTIFTNGMVFIKHDGYYIAEVLFDEPMLKENAMNHLKQYVLNHKNKAVSKEGNIPSLTHIMYMMYSIVSLLYTPILIVGTLISAFMPG